MARAHRSESFRIIAGRWRGRRLSFPADEDVRPTPDRVRETLFSWLSPLISGARCLDLYAGSGALGLEALSRGAGHACFVDRAESAVRAISDHLELLDAADQATVLRRDAQSFLERDFAQFDVVFLDPPFGDVEIEFLLNSLAGKLKPYNRVYLETDRTTDITLSSQWELLRDKRAGRVRYRLLTMHAADADR